MPWVKGQSGNPGGRPKVATEVRTRAKAKAADFYEVIEGFALDEKADPKLRLQAAKIGLAIAGVPMGEDKSEPTTSQPSIGKGATTEQLMAAAVAGEG